MEKLYEMYKKNLISEIDCENLTFKEIFYDSCKNLFFNYAKASIRAQLIKDIADNYKKHEVKTKKMILYSENIIKALNFIGKNLYMITKLLD